MGTNQIIKSQTHRYGRRVWVSMENRDPNVSGPNSLCFSISNVNRSDQNTNSIFQDNFNFLILVKVHMKHDRLDKKVIDLW